MGLFYGGSITRRTAWTTEIRERLYSKEVLFPCSYSEDVLEFTNIEAGETICVAGMELNVLKTLDGYDGYLGIGNGGFTNGVQVIVDDAIYERLTGKDTYSEFLPTLNEGADRGNF